MLNVLFSSAMNVLMITVDFWYFCALFTNGPDGVTESSEPRLRTQEPSFSSGYSI